MCKWDSDLPQLEILRSEARSGVVSLQMERGQCQKQTLVEALGGTAGSNLLLQSRAPPVSIAAAEDLEVRADDSGVNGVCQSSSNSQAMREILKGGSRRCDTVQGERPKNLENNC